MDTDDINFVADMLKGKTIGESNRSLVLVLLILGAIGYSVYYGIVYIYLGLSWGLDLDYFSFLFLGLICLTNIIFGIALWKWKIWGLYGMVAVLLVNAGALISFESYTHAFFSMVFFPGLLIIYTRDAWKRDEKSLQKTRGERNRGWFLTLLLIVIIIINLYFFISSIFTGYIVSGHLGSLIMFLNAPAVAIFAIAIWKWKRWGVYGIVAASMLAAGTELMYPDFVGTLIIYFVCLGILFFAIRNKWDQFE